MGYSNFQRDGRGGDPEKPHHVTVLHLGPITSAVHAVRAAIVQEFRSLEPAQEI
jgi:hypothetical protein